MKSEKKPTRKQAQHILAAGLNSRNWLIVKNQNDQMLLKHRETGTLKTIIGRN
jgi:hypothetical protein